MIDTNLSIEIDGHSIAYQEKDGILPTLLFLHGNSSTKASFKYQFTDSIFNQYRMIAIDLPGHGSSSWYGPNFYSVPEMAKIVEKLIKKMGLNNLVLIGHSLGGHIAIETLPLCQEIIGLFLFGTPPVSTLSDLSMAFVPDPYSIVNLPGNIDHDLAFRSAKNMARYASPSDCDELCKSILETDPQFRPAFFQSILQNQFADECKIIETYKIPTHFYNSFEDPLISTNYIKNLPIIKNELAKLSIFEKCTHYPQIEISDEFNLKLDGFISSLN